MAKILEKKTIYGSLVTEKIAGIESTAKMRSVNSIIIKTRNSGVIFFTPSIVTKNLLPTNWLCTLKNLFANFTTGWFSTSENKETSKNVHDPAKLGNQGCSYENKHKTHHDSS